MEQETKICADCGIRKLISEFYLNKNERDGHSRICKLDAKLREEKRRRERGIFPKGSSKIDNDHRRCRSCGQIKRNLEFTLRKDRTGGYRSQCKDCVAKKMEKRRRDAGVLAYTEAVASSAYTGVYVGEHLIADKYLREWFTEVIHAPNGTPGHDFLIIDKGKLLKVEVKLGSRLIRPGGEGDRWQFNINRNKIADMFFFIALNDTAGKKHCLSDIDHIWYIPAQVINTDNRYVTVGEFTLDRWSAWEKPIDKVLSCCDALKTETYEVET